MLATLDEVIRAVSIGLFGGLAGTAVVTFPGSPLWLVPAGAAVAGCALTIPEIRNEVRALLPDSATVRGLLPASSRGHERPREQPERTQERTGTPTTHGTDTPAVNLHERLDSTPHRLVVGHTGGGKTTLLHSMATRWAETSRVIVCDPDAAPGMWAGCEVAGYGDDLSSIAASLNEVRNEITRRRTARAGGVRSFPPLHLVVDEAHMLREVPDALPVIEDVLRRGRKLNVRATLGTQDSQVGTLGLEGKSALLANLQRVDVVREPDGRRVARFGKDDTQTIPNLPDPEQFITRNPRTIRVRRVPAEPHRKPVAAEQDDLLTTLLNSVPSASASPGNASGNGVDTVPLGTVSTDGNEVQIEERGGDITVNVTQVVPPRLGGTRARKKADTAELEARYRERGAAGVTFREAYAELKGSKEIAFTAWQEGKGTRTT
ncbi:hypothetical protein EYB53_018110 [Candidatus Chloroploca sp. M-50]|uniref:AAA+ ATPase domain-containing protein n=1 Tax=Candidatus Chloroploca mongolica TaxID=2528176 RepID=A0ABS4DDW1_9CHLR|nr:type IV secretory system conjugative DNA transfer family protein [Candidatus Chloroploca mongolica]MBP1467634.1 hypothetical protein [Candidatus Chloroploca mongolica]